MFGRTKAIVALVVLVIVVAGVASTYAWKQGKGEKRGERATPQWSVVYLSSGEIYVGSLTWGKQPKLDQAYLVARVQNEKTRANDITLQPLAETVWAPATLTLNPDHVLFRGPLDMNSSAAQRLKEKGVIK